MATKRYKGNRIQGRFLAIPQSVFDAACFVALSPHAKALLLDLGAQYKGDNNGDLSLAWKLMKPRGWNSQTTLHKAKDELLSAELLFETRKGQRPNKCSLYALTWLLLDPSPKYDPGAQSAFTRHAYKKFGALPPPAKSRAQNARPTPRDGAGGAGLLHQVEQATTPLLHHVEQCESF